MKEPDFYIGLSTTGHDPAMCIVDDLGQVVFAEATERFLQQKRAWGIAADHPEWIRQVLPNFLKDHHTVKISRSWKASKKNDEIDLSGGMLIADNMITWLSSLQNNAHNHAGENVKSYLNLPTDIALDSFDHHLCHAVNATYSSSFQNSLCLVVDGEGEVGAVSLYQMKDRELKRLWRSWGPGSLGSYYGWLTEICGFDWRRGEEWKVMGLAAYGKPRQFLVDEFLKMIQIKSGKPYSASTTILADVVERLKLHFRTPDQEIMLAADLAASGQIAFGMFMDQILTHCEQYEEKNLILSGGCALNSSYNGTILGRFSYAEIHVPSAPADDGNALGAAILSWMNAKNTNKIPYSNGSPFLGKTLDTATVDWSRLAKYHPFKLILNLEGESAKIVAEKLYEGKIIGIMRGGAEFGPRSLGSRSILADPRDIKTKHFINNEIKGRESYRPFAPIIFEKDMDKFFEKCQKSPYMSFTLPWKLAAREIAPAVVHADGTGRLQTITEVQNPWLCALLTEFNMLSGVPILLNTSFNVMGKPIVNSLEDALVVLATTGLDAILYENMLIEK